MELTKYISFHGLYEIWKGTEFEVYNNITDNVYEWKDYAPKIRLNEHNYLEMVLDLSDVTLMGTKNYLKNLDEVLNNI